MCKFGLLSRIRKKGAPHYGCLLVGVIAMLMSSSALRAEMNPFITGYTLLKQSVSKSYATIWLAELDSAGAARLVESRTGGRVLAVSEEERGGNRVYRVKVLLPEGRVRTLFIDKQSGAVREG